MRHAIRPDQHAIAAPLALQPQARLSSGTVALGGPVADLQREIESRLGPTPSAPVSPYEGAVAGFSRAIGPALLLAGYLTVAAWWFGLTG